MFKSKSFLAEQNIKDSLMLSKGIDTYVKQGSKITQLTMQADARAQYLEPCAPFVSLLLREDKNPLMEEGDYIDPSHRMRHGEFYLTHDAMVLLVEKKIRHHKLSKKGLPYHSRNIYIIKNDLGNLEYILTALNLGLDEDAKIIYISGIHSIPIYLRNQQGSIRCFIVDSEASVNSPPDPIIDIFYRVFPQLELVISTTTLQRDYYSCSTFAFKALMYFVKHGTDIFPWIDAATTIQKNYSYHFTYKRLEPDDLMPALLKMAQSRLNLSPERLATIVSTKQKLTLNDYFQRYTRNFDADEKLVSGQFSKQNVNSAALVKKYRYFILLNDYLQKMTQQDISSSPCKALPDPIQKRVDNYAIIHELPQKKSTINPIDTYLDIVSFLDDSTRLLNQHSQLLFNQIQLKFPNYYNLYLSFINDTWVKDKEILVVKKLFFVAALSEINHLRQFYFYDDCMLKLNRLFSNYPMIITYLKHHALSHSKQPVHDLCLFVMPVSDNWNKAYWVELVIKHGIAATRYLAIAPQIDMLLTEHAAARNSHSFTDLAWIKYLLQNFSYKQADKNKKFAALCVAFNRSELQFEKSLALVNHGLKEFDCLPEITLQGSDIDKRLARFTFAKLPVDDLRGLFLGEYTSCCQSLHKAGENYAIHGMISPFSGFYVVYDNKKIVAQSWVWIGKGGEIVFDSWEYINKNQSYLCKPFILKAAEQFVNAGFTKVVLGKGGHTPDLSFVSVDKPVQFSLPNSCVDSDNQYLIQLSPYQTILARFKVFTDYVNTMELYANNYYLFEQSLDTNAIATQLIQLIAINKLSFDHFFKLTKFLYICQHEVLHQHTELLLTAVKAYGSQMRPLFLFKNITNRLITETVIALDDVSLLQSIIINLADDTSHSVAMSVDERLINTLLFCSVASNAINNLQYLYSLSTTQGSCDDLAALVNHNNQSLLFYSTAHHAFKCVEFMLARMQNKRILADLLHYQDKKGVTILHMLAKSNQLDSFKLIERLCAGNDVIPKLLDHKSLYQYSFLMRVNVKTGAFISGSYDFLKHLLEYWSGDLSRQQRIHYLLHTIEPSIFNPLLKIGDIKGLAFLHSLHDNEAHWLKSLTSLWQNPLQIALQAGQFNCACFLIDSLTHIDHLHQLLTYSGNDPYLKTLPLDSCSDYMAPKESEQLLRKILSIYAPYRHKAADLFCTKSHAILSGLIKLKNDNLFKDILIYLASDMALFERVLFINSYGFISQWYTENLLNSLIKVKCSEEDQQVIVIFIDILFDFISLDQQKRMLLELQCLDAISSKINLNYLLKKIEHIGDDLFRRQWANFEINGPLMRGIYNHNSAITIIIIDYYTSLYTRDRIKAFLFEHWKTVSDRLIDDVILMNHMHSILQDEPEKLKELFLVSDSIKIKKIILINSSVADRNDLLTRLKAQSLNDIDKIKQIRVIKKVRDYIELLTKIDILRALKRSLHQQLRLQAGIAFFPKSDLRQDAIHGLLATFNDTLFYLNESNQWIFTEAKSIDECWQAVKSILSDMVINQVRDDLAVIYQNYYNQMMQAELVGDELSMVRLVI